HGYSVRFLGKAGQSTHGPVEFDQVVIRHGPDLEPVLRPILPDEIRWEDVRNRFLHRRSFDPTPEKIYRDSEFDGRPDDPGYSTSDSSCATPDPTWTPPPPPTGPVRSSEPEGEKPRSVAARERARERLYPLKLDLGTLRRGIAEERIFDWCVPE